MTIKVGILIAGHIDAPHIKQYKGYAEMFRQLFQLVRAPFEYQDEVLFKSSQRVGVLDRKPTSYATLEMLMILLH